MATIICAVRGGEPSRVVQRKAIDMALEGGHSLIFLFVVDVHGLGEMAEGLQEAAVTELAWFGSALLGIAQRRAERLGVTAEIAIRYGRVAEQIPAFIQSQHADYLLLGCPRAVFNKTIFTEDAIRRFANDIEHRTGIDVILVPTEP